MLHVPSNFCKSSRTGRNVGLRDPCYDVHRQTQYVAVQVEDLAKTIDAVPADAVVVATPMDLNRLIHMSKPSTTVA